MAIFDSDKTMEDVVRHLKAQAEDDFLNEANVANTAYRDSCRALHIPTESSLILTREFIHGRWHCFHLSIAGIKTGAQNFEVSSKVTKKWLKAIFGSKRKLLWCVPNEENENVQHFFLFCDDDWKPAKAVSKNEGEMEKFGWIKYTDKFPFWYKKGGKICQ